MANRRNSAAQRRFCSHQPPPISPGFLYRWTAASYPRSLSSLYTQHSLTTFCGRAGNHGYLKNHLYRMLGVAALLVDVSSRVANRLLSDSARVGWEKTASLRAVYGTPPSMAIWIIAMISPP